MTKLEFVVHVRAPIDEVYAYTVNPNHWPDWYPGTTAVAGAPAVPKQGDTWEESVTVAKLPLRFVWRAVSLDPPHEWTLEGTAKILGPFGVRMDGGAATLQYKLQEEPGGTSLRRDVVFRFANPILGLANRFLLKRKIAAELKAGLEKLSHTIESQAGRRT